MAEKKIVVKVDIHDDKGKQKALNAVSSLSGVNAISMDMKDKKMTVIGVVDPCDIVEKLRKHWHVEIVTVGSKEEPKKPEPPKKPVDELVKPYTYYNPNVTTQYVVYSREEDPNACVIC